MSNINTNNTLTVNTIRRIANGKVAYINCGELSGNREQMEAFMRRKAREIRMANPDLHLHLEIDWNLEEVPVAWDSNDWVLAPVGEIRASRR